MKNLSTKSLGSLVFAGALAMTIGLAGCGGQQPSATEQPAQTETTTQQEPEATATDAQQQAPEATATESQQQAAPAPAPAPTAPATDNYIGNEEAKRIALAHAGVNEADVYDLDAELDFDDAVVHYDVDFKAGGMEYDYDIDAVTGEILYFNSEYDD